MTTIAEAAKISIQNDIHGFAVIAKHLLTQGERCYSWTNDCAYRGFDDVTPYSEDEEEYYDNIETVPNGKSCAVGILIKDHVYHDGLEGTMVTDDEVRDAVISSHPEWILTDDSIRMMSTLQGIHDRGIIDYWPVYLYEMGKSFRENSSGELVWEMPGDYTDFVKYINAELGFDDSNSYVLGASSDNHWKMVETARKDLELFLNEMEDKYNV